MKNLEVFLIGTQSYFHMQTTLLQKLEVVLKERLSPYVLRDVYTAGINSNDVNINVVLGRNDKQKCNSDDIVTVDSFIQKVKQEARNLHLTINDTGVRVTRQGKIIIVLLADGALEKSLDAYLRTL